MSAGHTLNGHDASMSEAWLKQHLAVQPLEIDGVQQFLDGGRSDTARSIRTMLKQHPGLTGAFRSITKFVMKNIDLEEDVTLRDIAELQRSNRASLGDIQERFSVKSGAAGDILTATNRIFVHNTLSQSYVQNVLAGDFEELAPMAYAQEAHRRNTEKTDEALPSTLAEICVNYVTNVSMQYLADALHLKKKKKTQHSHKEHLQLTRMELEEDHPVQLARIERQDRKLKQTA